MAQQLKDQGKPYEIGFTAAQYEGYVVNINNLIKGFGGRVVNEDSTAPAIDDKTVQALTLLNKLATSGLTSSSLSNAQEPEVFADLQNGRSAFSLNWPYVLASMKEANPDLVPNLGYAPYPTVTAGAAHHDDAGRDELRDQHLQRSTRTRRSTRPCACARGERSSSRDRRG